MLTLDTVDREKVISILNELIFYIEAFNPFVRISSVFSVFTWYTDCL